MESIDFHGGKLHHQLGRINRSSPHHLGFFSGGAFYFPNQPLLLHVVGKLDSVTLTIWRNRKKNIALILKIKCLMFTVIEAAGRICDRKSVHKLENF
jgi:hypothetical protein